MANFLFKPDRPEPLSVALSKGTRKLGDSGLSKAPARLVAQGRDQVRWPTWGVT
jgi:hypothetical protein